jgi:hypothetical protein
MSSAWPPDSTTRSLRLSPQALQARDGKIHVVFTSEKRTVVNHAAFDEAWVAGAK